MNSGFAPTCYSYNVVVIATGNTVDFIDAGSLGKAQEKFDARRLDPDVYRLEPSLSCPESMKK